jgi:nitrogen fixation NifU-like protein
VSDLDDLYQELILDHYRRPRRKGGCAGCGLRARGDNPLCGDSVELRLALDDGRISDLGWDGQGCAISQASASMMAEAVRGKSVAEALALGEAVRRLMHGAAPARELGDLEALAGVARFPVRVKCALLPWTTLASGLGGREVSHG